MSQSHIHNFPLRRPLIYFTVSPFSVSGAIFVLAAGRIRIRIDSSALARGRRARLTGNNRDSERRSAHGLPVEEGKQEVRGSLGDVIRSSSSSSWPEADEVKTGFAGPARVIDVRFFISGSAQPYDGRLDGYIRVFLVSVADFPHETGYRAVFRGNNLKLPREYVGTTDARVS